MPTGIYDHSVRKKPLQERLMEKVSKDPSGCWLFTGAKHNAGYGMIHDGYTEAGNKKAARAHVVSYMLYKGEIPEGLCVLHSCDVRNCVNPDHLSLGTRADNQRDMALKDRSRNGNTKLTELQVKEVKARLELGESAKSIASDFDVSQWTVFSIKQGKNWSHV